MEKQLTNIMLRRAVELARKIPLDTLGRLADAVKGKSQPHPLLLPCSDTKQYEALALLVELLATIAPEKRREFMEQIYTQAKLVHTREKL